MESVKAIRGEISISEEIEILRELISIKILTPQDWCQFKEKFSILFPTFFPHILTKGIRLTKSEERLMALEKLNLNTSDMANILGISVESVYASRYRLKKKLKLNGNVSILSFLKGTC